MRHIGEIRMYLSEIHTLRNVAVMAVNERDTNTLRNKIKDMRRQLNRLENMLDFDRDNGFN